jgi:hypothetical protein
LRIECTSIFVLTSPHVKMTFPETSTIPAAEWRVSRYGKTAWSLAEE